MEKEIVEIVYFVIGVLTEPYSKVYSYEITSPGSFPFFLTGRHPIPNSVAREKANRNPLDSKPTTASTSGNFALINLTNKLCKSLHVGPSDIAEKISLNNKKKKLYQFFFFK